MVDNKNIYVEFDYQNIFFIDPNKVVDKFGNVKERLVEHENLVFYANLECNVLPRTKLSAGGSNESITQVSIAKINFLNPQSLKSQQEEETNVSQVRKYRTLKVATGLEDDTSSLLGITNITIKNNSSFMSTVSIELEDVRGRALFELGDNSPYASFFNMPYPTFYLTIKGYYGKAVKLSLILQSFSARFNTGTGNFNVSLVFYTYKFTMIAEVTMSALNAVPHMYRSKIIETSKQVNNGSQSSTSDSTVRVLERGRQKITEVYGEYKAKGLIPDDFPEFTLWELYKRLELFIKNIENSYSKVDMTQLNDLQVFDEEMSNLNGDVITKVGVTTGSWSNRYLDQQLPIVVTINGGESGEYSIKIFQLKKNLGDTIQKIEEAKSNINGIFENYNKIFSQNKTCSAITETFKKEDVEYNDKIVPDVLKTYIERKKQKPNDLQLENFRIELQKELAPTKIRDVNGEIDSANQFFYLRNYLEKINRIFKKYEELRKNIETELGKQLKEKLVSKETGIGFLPTIRNVLAVIFASGEAYLRLLDEVHTKAWEQRDKPERKLAISREKEVNSDAIVQANGTTPVYPWPQFIVKNDESGYDTEYPGNKKFQGLLNSGDYELWPEVEFVEEYIYGLSQREYPTTDIGDILNEETEPKRISINGIEFPISSQIYQIKENTKFLYEIWERTYLTSNYDRLNRNGSLTQLVQLISNEEVKNIVIALEGGNPYLTRIFKQYKLDRSNILPTMRHWSNNGIGNSWQKVIREQFVTPYITNLVDNSFSLLTKDFLYGKKYIPTQTDENVEKIKNYISSTQTNLFDFCDTVPFTDSNWVKNNMANALFSVNGERELTNSNKTIFYNQNYNTITNFTEDGDPQKIVPITNFNYLNVAGLPDTNFGIDLFYINRTIENQFPTEGTIFYSGTGLFLSNRQTTSILNTPYFINSIQTGVNNFKAGNPNPFVSSAYLFLNSLPLGTLREKHKTYDGLVSVDLDYIWGSLKKFGAVHRLPYAWVLKYGSIWYRYKLWKETGFDIINNDWSNFNYKGNYDPIGSDPTKVYNLSYKNPDNTLSAATIVLEDNINPTPIDENTVINLGFYPGLINDYNVFLQGVNLFNGFSDPIIQSVINTDFTLIPGSVSNLTNYSSGSKILGAKGFDLSFTGRTLYVNPWTCFVSVSGSTSKEVYLLPSFGTNVNQTKDECFDTFLNIPILREELTGNTAMYNGSVRLFWGAPNFGYFDHNRLIKPKPDQYLKQVYINQSKQENFNLLVSGYTDISDIFGTFEKDVLDRFEIEFLKFSKSIYDFNPNEESDSEYSKYGNFQKFFRNLLKIDKPQGSSFENIIEDAQQKQLKNIFDNIKGFMEHTIIFRYGNPSNFKRQIFNSFSNNIIQDSYKYFNYIPGSLPTSVGVTTLAGSQASNTNAWLALETHVGFSTIPQLVYSNNGSYITDFFVDMNVEFSEINVVNLAPIIKIYATQKLKDTTIDQIKFKNLVTDYLKSNADYQNTMIDAVFAGLQNELPNIDVEPERSIDSKLDGDQTKRELWEVFKTLNDKWIAGYDFSNKTLFEDVLLLDRASRDVGNKVTIDIYELKSTLYSIGDSKSNMLMYVQSIIEKNNFIIFNSPSYVNFYNVQDVVKDAIPKIEDPTQFANDLFGTHTTVDTRSSSSKLVCIYAGNPSAYLSAPENKNYKFRSDAFDITKPAGNPIIEDIQNKNDWGLSNKVIGFNVDVGTRNQNVFYNVQFDQNPGKATSASIQALTDLVNQAGNRTSYTQNQSLYNLYKTLSYTSTISCLGNAMIQPTMYFNLRHVPLFNGPYLILDVNHNITPGRFETIFTGIRQPIATLPIPDSLIQSINKTLISNIKTKLKNDIGRNFDPNQNILQQEQILDNNLSNVNNDNNTGCIESLTSSYKSWAVTAKTDSSISFTQLKTYIDDVSSIEKVKLMIFVTVCLNSNTDVSSCKSFNYNHGGVTLDTDWSGGLQSFFSTNKNYVCIAKNDKPPRPYVVFDNFEKHIGFLEALWRNIISAGVLGGINPDTVTKAYLDYYPNLSNQGAYDNLERTNVQLLEKYKQKVSKAIQDAKYINLIN